MHAEQQSHRLGSGAGGARASAFGLGRLAHGASLDRAAEIFAGRSFAHHAMRESDRDQRLADAARAGKKDTRAMAGY